MKEVIYDDAQLIRNDCRKVLPEFDNDSISLIVTSVPYKKADGAGEDLFRPVFRESYRILKPGGACFVNIGHLAENKYLPHTFAEMMRGLDWELLDNVNIWFKGYEDGRRGHHAPLNGNNLDNYTEFLFIFYKREKPKLSRFHPKIGIPYSDPKNIERFAHKRKVKCRGNAWFLNYKTHQNSKGKHPHGYPPELPHDAILLSGIQDGIVLDMFGGHGTTCAGMRMVNESECSRLHFVGIEKDSQKFKEMAAKLKI